MAGSDDDSVRDENETPRHKGGESAIVEHTPDGSDRRRKRRKRSSGVSLADLRELLSMINLSKPVHPVHVSERNLCLDLSNQVAALRHDEWRQSPGLILSHDLAAVAAPLTSALAEVATVGVHHLFKKDELKLLIVEALRHAWCFDKVEFELMIRPLAASLLMTAFTYNASQFAFGDRQRLQKRRDREADLQLKKPGGGLKN